MLIHDATAIVLKLFVTNRCDIWFPLLKCNPFIRYSYLSIVFTAWFSFLRYQRHPTSCFEGRVFDISQSVARTKTIHKLQLNLACIQSSRPYLPATSKHYKSGKIKEHLKKHLRWTLLMILTVLASDFSFVEIQWHSNSKGLLMWFDLPFLFCSARVTGGKMCPACSQSVGISIPRWNFWFRFLHSVVWSKECECSGLQSYHRAFLAVVVRTLRCDHNYPGSDPGHGNNIIF